MVLAFEFTKSLGPFFLKIYSTQSHQKVEGRADNNAQIWSASALGISLLSPALNLVKFHLYHQEKY